MSAPVSFLDGKVVLHAGDCRDVIRSLPDSSIDSIVTDPPYALVSIVKRFGKPGAAPVKSGDAYARASAGFMGKEWDTGEAAFATEFWAECLRVLKPGGHVAAFSGTRTYHRLAIAIEDSGFEIRDQLAWAYGSGFPKSHDVSKALDKSEGIWRGRAKSANAAMAGPNYERTEKGDPITDSAREWQGWGTALKPAWEPICLARKPLVGTVAANVLAHGTGAINIDGCRVGEEGGTSKSASKSATSSVGGYLNAEAGVPIDAGRFPANILHDGSPDVVAMFPAEAGGSGKASGPSLRGHNQSVARGSFNGLPDGVEPAFYGDTGSPARFFYSAKADASDRIGSKHPTVKPVDLMQWLCRLITPPGGVVFDPFAGTGTTGEAAFREGFRAVLIEREEEYRADIKKRMGFAVSSHAARKRAHVAARSSNDDLGPLFGTPDPVRGGQTDLRPLCRPKRTIGPTGLKR